jgi:glycosyltransferase involved in cell wall biosynthesis
MNAIEESKKVNYQFYPTLLEDYEDDKMTLSIIIDCYFNLRYVKESVESALNQDYPNVEIMLIDNGASEDISSYLKRIYNKNKNIALLVYKENQFDWKFDELFVLVCWNAALLRCKGEFVTHLSYDDKFSKNYASSMIQLFADNPNCNTAAPLPVSINKNGKENPVDYLSVNNRSRYMVGKDLVLDFLGGSPRKFFQAPGEIFVIRRDLLIKYGGFDRGIDLMQILKYVIHGETGFDKNAHVYWRHHENQVNRILTNRGYIWVKFLRQMIIDSDIMQIWEENLGKDDTRLLKKWFSNKIKKIPIDKLIERLLWKDVRGYFNVLLNILKEYPAHTPRAIISSSAFLIVFIIKNIFRKILSRDDINKNKDSHIDSNFQ